MADLTPPNTYLGQRFADYADTWPAADSVDAMACRELEERLAYGLTLYRLAMDAATAVAERMRAEKIVYDLPGAKYVESLLTLWVAPYKVAFDHIATVEARGCTVGRAAEFREAVMDARVSISIPVERVAAQAELFAREGFDGTKTTEDLRRELRRRVGA